MSQSTAFGEAELVTYMKVTRAAIGVPTEYYRVEGGQNVPISAAEYAANTELCPNCPNAVAKKRCVGCDRPFDKCDCEGRMA